MTRGDFNRLYNGIYLNDLLIDFYLDHLQTTLLGGRQDRFKVLSPHFYSSVKSDPCKAAQKWESKETLFGHDFVFVPVNEKNHWIVLILCYMPNVFKQTEPITDAQHLREKPQALILDSLGSGSTLGVGVMSKVRTFLRQRLQWEKANAKNFPIPQEQVNLCTVPLRVSCCPVVHLFALLHFCTAAHSPAPPCVPPSANNYCVSQADEAKLRSDFLAAYAPKVPRQQNRSDCGLYMLQFIENFMKDPPSAPKPIFADTWVTPQQASQKRKDIQDLITSLSQRRAANADKQVPP